MFSIPNERALSEKAGKTVIGEREKEVDRVEKGQIEQIPRTDKGHLNAEAHVKMILI